MTTHSTKTETHPMTPHTQQETAAAEAPHKQRKLVRIFLEGGVIQDYDVPKGVELFVQDQDEIEAGEKGTWSHDGGADPLLAQRDELQTRLGHADEAVKEFGRQRDELLAACKLALGQLEHSKPLSGVHSSSLRSDMEILRAAIQKCQT